MTKEEKIKKIESLKIQSSVLKREVDYYDALQGALKLILNGSYFLPHFLGSGAKIKELSQHSISYCLTRMSHQA